MKRIPALLLSSVLLLEGLTGCGSQQETAVKNFTAPEQGEELVVIHVKDYGTIKIKVFSDLLPKACENFVTHAKDGYYDGLPFHRVIENFMIQGGDPNGNGTGGSSQRIKGEFSANGVQNDLKHTRGVLSMARSSAMDSASSQFFIMHADAPHLDGQYAAFGKVISGMEVVDAICENTPVTDRNGTVTKANQPVIERIIRVEKPEE